MATKTEEKKNIPAATQKAAAPEPFNPFGKRTNVNAGTVAIEETRATTEAMGKLYLAKSFPRDEAAAYDKIMLSCQNKALAEKSQYSYPKGGATVSGISIRLAEELARCWGNIDYGIKELSNKDGESEMEAFCWDLETNTYSSQKFTVKHERSAKGQITRLTDQRDIYENNANMGARRLRARILAVLPPALVDGAESACKRTLLGDTSKIKERVKNMLLEFKKFDVTQALIEKRLNKKAEDVTQEEFAELISIHNALRDGFGKAADWFDVKDLVSDGSTPLGKLNQEIAGANPEPGLV